jgi:hypothetical protein
MDVGIIPESHRLDALGAQGINAGKGAGGAAGVKKNGVHKNPHFCPD